MSKKVIEPVIIETKHRAPVEINVFPEDGVSLKQWSGNTQHHVFIDFDFTKAAKAIDPEYQKVEDMYEHNLKRCLEIAAERDEANQRNAKLMEALEKVKDMLESPKIIDGRVLRHIVNEALQNNKKIEG